MGDNTSEPSIDARLTAIEALLRQMLFSSALFGPGHPTEELQHVEKMAGEYADIVGGSDGTATDVKAHLRSLFATLSIEPERFDDYLGVLDQINIHILSLHMVLDTLLASLAPTPERVEEFRVWTQSAAAGIRLTASRPELNETMFAAVEKAIDQFYKNVLSRVTQT